MVVAIASTGAPDASVVVIVWSVVVDILFGITLEGETAGGKARMKLV